MPENPPAACIYPTDSISQGWTDAPLSLQPASWGAWVQGWGYPSPDGCLPFPAGFISRKTQGLGFPDPDSCTVSAPLPLTAPGSRTGLLRELATGSVCKGLGGHRQCGASWRVCWARGQQGAVMRAQLSVWKTSVGAALWG